ncbi:polysaccharide export protein [Roseovarius sp. A21]|uniref:Polysaccharide export protein n=2 Tax=Roseovarius bejariae TaxID=2576383 RepID=A0A844D1H3_9RHOB|nr:polysaccharide export protein [Roseovarius bejariae]
MESLSIRMTKLLVVAVLVSALGACGLPRPGPTKSEIRSLDGEINETQIVEVDERVNRLVAVQPKSGFPDSIIKHASSTLGIIRPGDTLSFTIYENVDEGVLSRGNGGTSTLNSLEVDEAGFVFIPYAGRIRAAGNTTEALRRIITRKLEALTPEPQVLVQRAAGDDETVSVLGNGIAAQGVYPIERSSRRLMEMLATAGGITTPPEMTRVKVLRHQHKGEIWFEDVYDYPEYDLKLHAGDRIFVNRDPRVFTVLGSTGKQANVPFGMRQLSALQAIAQAGGLNSQTADPTGLFVIRKQDSETVNKMLDRNDFVGEQSVIYVLNLTEPNGIPLAQDFDIRDGDAIYVTEAPFVQWTKTLNAITGTAGAVNTVEAVGD